MKTYWVMWTYIANYSERPIKVTAESPEHAIKLTTGYYSDDFKKKASVYVFDREPVLWIGGRSKDGYFVVDGNVI